jgi:uncharacterized protein (TIGR02246 family)
MHRRALLVLRGAWPGLVAGVVSGCVARGAEPTADPAGAQAAIAAADSAWAAAAAARDLEASVGALAVDGIMFPPGQPPVIGRAAARAFMQHAFATPGFSVSWTTDTVIVAPDGQLAYTLGRSRYTFPDAAGGLDTLHAKAVGVWRREADGQWRAVADIWNEAPPLPRIVPTASGQ